MQEFSLAFSRVSRSAIAMNPELKARVAELVARAYHNIHGLHFSNADPAWTSAISATALQLSLDERAHQLSVREIVQLFENVIRISEEHLREARRHAAMASNVFYLKETALDAIMVEAHHATYHAIATTILGGSTAAHSGRLEVPKPDDPVA